MLTLIGIPNDAVTSTVQQGPSLENSTGAQGDPIKTVEIYDPLTSGEGSTTQQPDEQGIFDEGSFTISKYYFFVLYFQTMGAFSG